MTIKFEDDHAPEEVDALREDMEAYLESLNNEEIRRVETAQVIDIRSRQLAPAHTEDELVPLAPSDVIFRAMVFDPEESLRQAAHQKWLVDGVIPGDSFGILYGASGSYKSFVAVDIASSIAYGRKWHEFDIDGKGPVLYVAAEGAAGLKERSVAWNKYHNVPHGRMVILPMGVMLDDPIQVQLFVEAAIKAQEALGEPFKMVVIDTMARSFNGDENSAQDTGAFINSCYDWKSRLDGPTILIIAHAGKSVDRGIRGSSALKAACDFVFAISKPAHLQVLFKNEKQKDIDECDDMRFAMQPVHLGIQDHKGRERKSLVPILESKGSMADPENEDGDLTVFEVGDLKSLVMIVLANERLGQQMTEDDLKKEFIEKRMSEGAKPDAARKAFSRNLGRAKDRGHLMKHGKFISKGEVPI